MTGIRWVAVTLAVALLYFACGHAGLTLAFVDGQATPVWPPAGIGLGLTLLYGPRILPGLFLGAWLTNAWQLVWVGGHPWVAALPVALGVGFGNTTETLLVFLLLQRFTRLQPFSSLQAVLVFIGACTLGGLVAAGTALFSVIDLWANEAHSVRFLLIWWLGDLASQLLLAPPLVLWRQAPTKPRTALYPVHLFAYAGVAVLVVNVGLPPAGSVTLGFLLLPLLVWGTLAFGRREVSVLLVLLASLMLYKTLTEPLPDGVLLHDVLLGLQLKICLLSASAWVLGTVFAERWRWRAALAQGLQQGNDRLRIQIDALKSANQQLHVQLAQQAHSEKRWQEHEERLALITQATTDGLWEWELPGLRLRLSSRFKGLLGYDQFDLLPPSLRFWLRKIAPEDRHGLLQNVRDHFVSRKPLVSVLRMGNKAGVQHWYRVQGHATWDEKGRPVLLAGSIADVHREQVNHGILLSEKRLLERMTSGASLREVLELVVELLQVRFLEAGMAIARVDEAGVNLHLLAQRGLDSGLQQLLGGLKVGPQAVSMGAALYFNSPVVVEDVVRQVEWRPFLPLLRGLSIRACWALPVRNRHGTALGSLTLCFAMPRLPDADDTEFLDRVARLAGMAIEQEQIRTTLQRSELRYRELYHHNPAMFFSLTTRGLILSVNRFGAEHLGYAPEDLVDKPLADLLAQEDRDALQTALQKTLAQPGRVQVFEARSQCADGRWLWVRDSLRALGNMGEQMEILVVAEDITDIRALSERLEWQASHDALTGLINRRKFEAELVEAIYQANRQQRVHGLCYLDLDLFKVINDTCGHAAGDELLRQLGTLLQETVAGRGLIARLGGDEFGLLILDTDERQVQQLASEVRDRISGYPFIWERRSYHVGVSIGVAMVNADTSHLGELMIAADSACYAAKESGCNQIRFHREDDAILHQRRGDMRWVTLIPRGVRENRFALAVQEIVPLAAPDGMRHVELLLRYRDQDGQWVPPEAFLPAAERYGLASLLDRWVCVQLLHLLQAQPRLQGPEWLFSINLSRQSLVSEGFRDFLLQQLAQQALPARCICFELAESSLVTGLSGVRSFISALQVPGCRFALDNFGSGLSSLGQWQDLPIGFIKIDGRWVESIGQDALAFTIVKSISDVSRVLGKQTIATNVESAAVARKLQDAGVEWGQGYHLAQPRLLDEWLAQMAMEFVPVQMQDVQG